MNIYRCQITAEVIVPAETLEDATQIHELITESVNLELANTLKSENRRGLSGEFRAGAIKPLGPVCAMTLEAMTRQLELPGC